MPVTLIDGFENWSGGLPVGWGLSDNGVISQSVEHATQGTYSAEIVCPLTGAQIRGGILSPDEEFLSPGDYLVDAYLVSGSIEVSWGYRGQYATGTYTSSSAGYNAVSFNIPEKPSPELGNAYVSLNAVRSGVQGEVYFDNLRLIADDIFEPSTKEFTLSTETVSFIADTVISQTMTIAFSLTAPSSELTDGFENWSEGLPVGWGFYNSIITQSTSHVTQGMYSALVSSKAPSHGYCILVSDWTIPEGRYYIDVFVPGGIGQTLYVHGLDDSFGVGIPLPDGIDSSFSVSFSVPPGAGDRLVISLESDPFGQSRSFWVDNLRLIADDFAVLTDEVISVSAPKEFIFDYGMVFAAPDWLAADWLAADWEETGAGTIGIRFFADEVIDASTTKGYELVINTPTFFTDTVLPSGNKEFELGFETLAFFGDQVFVVAAPKAYDLALTPDLDFYTGHVFEAATTDFTLEPQDVEFYFELYRSFPVINSSEFKYELLGVSVETEEGAGRFTVFTGNDILVADVPYTTTSTNTALSGIIERGANLKVLVYMQNAYFRSFKADFAMKRIYE